VNDEFWLPMAATVTSPERTTYDFLRFTPQELAALRRLVEGEQPRKRWRHRAIRDRAALRRRRRMLSKLGIHDLRNLAELLVQLEL
jgi:hypothetical protein